MPSREFNHFHRLSSPSSADLSLDSEVGMRLAFWLLVMAMLSLGVADSKNPDELVQFTLNRKPKILLQWTPHVSHKIKLTVRGGCAKASDDYKWDSSDMRVVGVSSYGVIEAKGPGIATVKAVSTCDPQNYDEIVVKVLAREEVCYDMDDMEAKANPGSCHTKRMNTIILIICISGGTIILIICISGGTMGYVCHCAMCHMINNDQSSKKRSRRPPSRRHRR